MDPVLILGTALFYAGVLLFGVLAILRPVELVTFMDRAEVPSSLQGMRAIGVFKIVCAICMMTGLFPTSAIAALTAYWSMMTIMMLRNAKFDEPAIRINMSLHALKNLIIIGAFLHLWSMSAAGKLWNMGLI